MRLPRSQGLNMLRSGVTMSLTNELFTRHQANTCLETRGAGRGDLGRSCGCNRLGTASWPGQTPRWHPTSACFEMGKTWLHL